MAPGNYYRCLTKNFFDDLLHGRLNPLLQFILSDQTLDFQIRRNQVHVYYRGGKILDIKPDGVQDYIFSFDENYSKKSIGFNTQLLNSLLKDVPVEYKNYFPIAKQLIDLFLSSKSSEEREFQQLISRTNNYSGVANSTDYFIVDIEYANGPSRFDLIALEWPSISENRKLNKGFKPRLMIIEMKYSEGALAGKAGLAKHHSDIMAFIQNPDLRHNFINEMECIFLQKLQLELIPCLKRKTPWEKIIKFDDQIDIGYLIADHDPASKRLVNEIVNLPSGEAKFLTSNFSGYALYKENVFEMDDFKNRYIMQIG